MCFRVKHFGAGITCQGDFFPLPIHQKRRVLSMSCERAGQILSPLKFAFLIRSADSFLLPLLFPGLRAGLTFADFSIRSGEPMRWPGARALGLGLHARLPVQIQLLCLQSTFGREFLL
jgi:hypothetical protein